MKSIKTYLTAISLALICNPTKAQNTQNTEGVSIKSNPSAPHSSAMLDVESSTKGILIPRVALQSTTNGSTPIANPAVGLLVFNTNATAPLAKGYYYWDGIWKKLNDKEIWQEDPTNPSSIYYSPASNGSVTVGTPTTLSSVYSTTFHVYGPSVFFSMGALPANPPHSRQGIVIGDANHAPGVVQAGSPGGHWNEINCVDETLDIQWNTGKDVQIGAWGGSDLFVRKSSTGSKGNITAEGHIFAPIIQQTSDSTLKKNIVQVTSISEALSQCHTYSYNFKTESNEDAKHIGVLAQEIENYFPQLIRTIVKSSPYTHKFTQESASTNQTVKTVDYSGLTALLLQALKEQQAQINDLQSQITNLMER